MANKIFGWMKLSNRMKHFGYGIPTGLLTLLFTLGLALGMEFKDKEYGGKFDWLDVAATMIGGTIGQIVQIILFILIF